MPISGKEIIAILKKNGWHVKSQRGSHVKLVSNGKAVIVPVHGKKDLGKGLIRSLEKKTGVKFL